MQYRDWTGVHTVIMIMLAFALVVLAFAVGATEIVIGGPVQDETSQLPAMLNTNEDQLQHENKMAMTQTAMKVGEICVLLTVAEHVKKSHTPITLRALSKKSDACVKEQMSLLENRK